MNVTTIIRDDLVPGADWNAYKFNTNYARFNRLSMIIMNRKRVSWIYNVGRVTEVSGLKSRTYVCMQRNKCLYNGTFPLHYLRSKMSVFEIYWPTNDNPLLGYELIKATRRKKTTFLVGKATDSHTGVLCNVGAVIVDDAKSTMASGCRWWEERREMVH